ncbi:MAG: ABC transporter substrate-binding protein [Rhodospirillales bacterium]
MIGRRLFTRILWGSLLALGILALAGVPRPAAADEFSDGALTFIENLTGDAIQMLTGKDLSRDERADRFRKLMLKNFALKGIARFVLGRHWRKLTGPEKKEYLELFEDLMVATYADRFEKYSGEKLLVKKAEARGERDALVHTSMIRVDGTKALKVAWRVRGKVGNYKVVDIMVEGISMVMTQKSEFGSFIRQNDGGVSALLSELKKRLQAHT